MFNKLKLIISFIIVSSFSPNVADLLVEPIEDVNKDGKLDMIDIIPKLATKRQFKFARELENQVKKEVEWQNRRMHREALRDKVYDRVRLRKGREINTDDLIYKIPSWPFSSIYYAEKDLFEISLKANDSTKAFNSSGGSQDISKLVFGQKSIKLQDILLVSKLLRSGVLQSLTSNPNNTGHYYYILANQPIEFDASINSQRATVSYARHFRNGDISFGLEVPIVRRENKLKLISSISSTDRNSLQNKTPYFFAKYADLEEFFSAILGASHISFNKHDREVGLGDISTFINFEINSKNFERFIIGAKLLFPTANDREVDVLWHPDLGNGGFIECSIFAGLLLDYNKYFNPYVFVNITGVIPAKVSRRVPIKKEYDGGDPNSNVGDFLILGDTEVQYKATTFSEFDTSVRRFPSVVKSIKIHKGPQFYCKLGNVFEEVLFKHGFLDTFYDVRLKASDYVGSYKDSSINPAVLKENTFEIDHRFGFNYDYQFSGRQRITTGFAMSIAGRNTPQTFEGNIAFSTEF